MTPLFAYFTFNALWLSVPPIAAFALVYAATRHERFGPIARHAGRVAFWTFAALAVIFLLLRLTT